MTEHQFQDIVDQIIKEDNRYTKSAYVFLRSALDHTIKSHSKKQKKLVSKPRHVSGQELLLGIKDYALDQFGPMAFTLLKTWGVGSCEDFGEMVFNLIEYNVFQKTEDDSKADFASIFTFEEAFLDPFKPKELRMKRPEIREIRSL